MDYIIEGNHTLVWVTIEDIDAKVGDVFIIHGVEHILCEREDGSRYLEERKKKEA